MKFTLRRVRINQGGYDKHGHYWGVGQPLYEYESDEGDLYQDYIRADNREHAKDKIRAKYPGATFYR